MKLKHTHRTGKKANEIPKSATFNPKAPSIPGNSTFSGTSKRKR